MGERSNAEGIVYLVGAGPGDAGLITVKGMRCLEEADIVVYDRLAGPRLIQMAKPDAVKIYVGKRPDHHAMKQGQINQLLVELAGTGKRVVRLKGGDPCVFGRVGEEAAVLKQHGIPYEIVPGVTSAVAVPAYAGIPVTHRDRASSFSVITGHETPERLEERVDWDELARATGTLLFLMGVGHIRSIAEQLMRRGRSQDTPVALVRYGTRAEQATLVGTLATIADEVERVEFRAPAVIIVGEVVLEREVMKWAESRPLFGQRVLVTRARAQSESFIRAIEALGGEPYEYPVIETKLPSDAARLADIEEALYEISSMDWLILTSANGVHAFMDHMKRVKMDLRKLASVRIVAVGPKTREIIESYGLIPEYTAEQFSQEGVFELLKDKVSAGERALIATADLARRWLRDQLQNEGLEVIDLDTYHTVLPDYEDYHIAELLLENSIQLVPFTSSSTVTHTLEMLKRHRVEDPVEALNRTAIFCIGEQTAKTALEAGLKIAAVSEASTMDGLLQAMLQWVQSHHQAAAWS